MKMFQAVLLLLITTAMHSFSEGTVYMDCRSIETNQTRSVADLYESGKCLEYSELEKQSRERQGKEVTLENSVKPLTEKLSAEDLYSRRLSSVAVLCSVFRCSKCDKLHQRTASGVFISKDGCLLTNNHIFTAEDDTEVMALAVMTSDGEFHPVTEVISASAKGDWALLKVDGADFTPAPLGVNPPVGRSIWIISHPGRLFYAMSEGIVSGFYSDSRDEKAISTSLIVTADFAVGSSGAPVFDDKGSVVGLVSSTQAIRTPKKHGSVQYTQMVLNVCVPVESFGSVIKSGESGK